MSSIDERIVRMEFDNRQFESGVSTTMSTLQKLKEALEFRKESTGFSDIQKASESVNFSPLNDSIWQVQQNFSFFGEFVRTVFDRISNRIVDLGSTMARELTTAPLRAGFSEYELQMGSTQTIMASTGASIEEVTRYLDELNTYADKTIYSFSDMTQNIGKFTNAGVDLDVAVKAIQGISNEAAVSGANAQQASHAMYNFAQALSSGYVKLLDWRSIETANMATKEFKQQLIDTAVEMGTLEETTDGMYRVLGTNANGATMREAISATKNFNDSLSYQWMTSDVLTATLAKYADETTDIGKKAFAAATEVKTFSQLIDTVKESLGSGWTKSFQYMIGNLEEAKVLWTGVNEEINSILDPIAEAREEMLKFWHDNGGRATAIQAIADAWQGIKAILESVGKAFEEVFPPMTGERLVAITKSIGEIANRFKSLTTSNYFRSGIVRIVRGIANALKVFVDAIKGVIFWFRPLIAVLSDFGWYLFAAAGSFGDFLTKLTTSQGKLSGVKDAFSKLESGIRFVVQGIDHLVKSLLGLIHINVEGNALTKIYDALSSFTSGIFGSFDINVFSSIGTTIENAIGRVSTAVSSLFSGNKPKIGVAFDFIGDVFSSLKTSVSDAIPKIIEYLGSDEFRDVLKNADLLAGGGFLLSLTGLSEGLKGFLDKTKGAKDSGKFFEKLAEAIKGIFQPFIDISQGAVDAFNGMLDTLKEHITNFQHGVRATQLVAIAFAFGVMAKSIEMLSKIDPDSIADAIAAIVVSFGILSVGLTIMTTKLKEMDFGKNIPLMLAGIAIALGIMARSVVMLSALSWDKLENGLAAVGLMLLEFAGFVTLVDGAKVGAGSVIALLAVAGAIKVLQGSVSVFASLSWDQLENGLAGVGFLILEVAGFLYAIDGKRVGLGAIATVLAVAGAVKALSGTVSTFAGISWDQLELGLAGVGFLLFELAAFMTMLDGSKFGLGGIVTILAVTVAINSLQSVVAAFGGMSWEQLGNGLAGVGYLVLEIATFIGILSGLTVPISSIVALGVLSLALVAIGDVLVSLGGIAGDGLSSSIGGVVSILGAIVIALLALGSASPVILAGAAAVLVVSAALAILIPVLTAAVKGLSELDPGTMLKTIGVMAIGMVALAGGMVALGLAAPFALLFAAAIALIGTSIGYVVGQFASLTTSLTNLAGLAGSLTIVTAFIESAVTAIGKGFDATITGIFNGLVNGIKALLDGIGPICESLGTAVHAIGEFLIQNVPYVLSVIGTIVTSVLEAIPPFIPRLASIIVQFLVTALQVIQVWLPVIAQLLVTGVVTLLNSVADGIRNNSESIFAAVRNILSSISELVLTALANIVSMIPGIGDTLAGFIEDGKDVVRQTLAPESFEGMTNDAMSSAVAGITQGGQDLSSAASDVGASVRDELVDGMGESTGISEEFMGPMLDEFQSYETEFDGIGNLYSDGLIGGFSDVDGAGASDDVVQSLLGNLQGYDAEFGSIGTSYAETFSSSLGNTSAESGGTSLINTAVAGLSGGTTRFSTAATQNVNAFSASLGRGSARSGGVALASTGVAGAGSKRGQFSSTGTDATTGFGYGMVTPYALSVVRSSATRVGQTALSTVRSTINAHSPSRETMKLGKYTTEGFAVGIKSLTGLVRDESENVGSSALDGLRDSLGRMSKYIDADIDYSPTIQPVLDLSQIQNGVADMNRILGNATNSPLVGVAMDAYAQRMMSAIPTALSSASSSSFDTKPTEITYNITLNYEASASANQMARDIMREVKRVQLTKG